MTSTSRFTCAITRFNANTITAATGTLLYPRIICGTPRHSRNSSSTIYVTSSIKNHSHFFKILVIISIIYAYFVSLSIKQYMQKSDSHKNSLDLRVTMMHGTSWSILEWNKVWWARYWPVKKPWIDERIASNCTAPILWSWRTFPCGWSRSTVIQTWATPPVLLHDCVDKWWKTLLKVVNDLI